MPSHQSHRAFFPSVLLLAAVLAVTSAPARPVQGTTLVDALGSKVQSWLAAWWPAGATTDSRGMTDPNGRSYDRAHAARPSAPGAAKGGLHAGRAPRGGIKIQCTSTPDPNGNCY